MLRGRYEKSGTDLAYAATATGTKAEYGAQTKIRIDGNECYAVDIFGNTPLHDALREERHDVKSMPLMRFSRSVVTGPWCQCKSRGGQIVEMSPFCSTEIGHVGSDRRAAARSVPWAPSQHRR
eukprot:3903798-Rhodomonas_salina.2